MFSVLLFPNSKLSESFLFSCSLQYPSVQCDNVLLFSCSPSSYSFSFCPLFSFSSSSYSLSSCFFLLQFPVLLYAVLLMICPPVPSLLFPFRWFSCLRWFITYSYIEQNRVRRDVTIYCPFLFVKQGNNSKIHLHVAYFFAVENKSPNFHIKIREQKICRR